jgi:hypothetical protein
LALAGVETLVSTRLDPGVDPIVEADRRGAILGVVRLGNKDLEIPGGPAGGTEVMPVSYVRGMGCPTGMPVSGPTGGPMAAPMGSGMGSIPTNYISGVTGPQYGMPMCGTPIGLPGPPHIPLGTQAGLRKHVIKNHTPVYMPGPTSHINIHVREQPGYYGKKPSNTAWIMGRRVSAACPPSGCLPGAGLLGGGGLLGGAGCNGSCIATTGQACSSCQ